MKNKLIALLTMSALAVGTLAGCGNTAATDTAASAADTVAETPVEAVSTAAAEATEAADTAADQCRQICRSFRFRQHVRFHFHGKAGKCSCRKLHGKISQRDRNC